MKNFKAGLFLIAAVVLLLLPDTVSAYIGPGAGFAVISSFFVLLMTGFLAFFTILFWPFRAVILYFRRRNVRKNKKVGRVVVLGLDGMDPVLAKSFMDEGFLPNFAELKQTGTFKPLATTCPSISPVAWSSFATGVNPGKHRIFDFYTRDPKSYLPLLSSVKISTKKHSIKIGPFTIPRNKTTVNFLRKATSFWKILGQHGIFSSVLRVPISFPPEKFYGTSLSAMCAPDLRGTQGAFTCFTSDNVPNSSGLSEGIFVPLKMKENKFCAKILGPQISHNSEPLSISMDGEIDRETDQVKISVNKETYSLSPGKYSPWIRLTFKNGSRKKISGIARFLVTQMAPNLRLYMSPINIDPEKPALPVSQPVYYSMILSKLYGSFSTLGLSEDTWALNERVIDEQDFLNQSYDIFEDRKKHFYDSIRKIKDGLIVSVFDTTDRIQHMFFRYLDPEHPANRDKDVEKHKNSIQNLYQRMDQMVGELRKKLGKRDLLMVISDHGFSQFKWGINLNTWLWQNGYLILKEGAKPGGKWFKGVDWSRTRAYAFGLTGIFINLKTRESQGIVTPGNERLKLQLELKEKLEAIKDENTRQKPIRRAMLSQMNLKGPYVEEAPDLIIGYAKGYRTSWNCAVGRIKETVIEPNTKSWSGDHSIDPELVPGVFFSNWKLAENDPAITDLAPTIQNLFGIKTLNNQDGRILNLAAGGIM